jgi:hypothetical protein
MFLSLKRVLVGRYSTALIELAKKNFLYSQKLVSITISRLCAVNIDPKDA